jgi:hypothetical protein
MTEPETSTGTYSESQGEAGSRVAFAVLGAAAALLLAVGTIAFHHMEGWSWVDSFYFSAIAGTTVGFGDLHPTTDASKLFSVAYIFFAVGIIGTYLNQRLRYGGGFVKRRTRKVISEETSHDQP